MRILTAVDRSEYAEIVLEHALDQVARHGGELHALTVIRNELDRGPARAWLDAAVREALDNFGLATYAYALHVRRGRPLLAISAATRDLIADLLVVGRFHVPSLSDGLVEVVDCPTLIAGPDGVVLDPQCPRCRDVRLATGGERLFCEEHSGERMLELATRLPPAAYVHSRMW
jgi:nucleotide-binding universal stress UspA family protein